jgi:hypothetical protein
LAAAICLIVLASVVFVVVLLRVSDQKAVDAKGLILAFIALLGLGISAVTAVYLATHGDRYMSEIKGEFWVNVYADGTGPSACRNHEEALRSAGGGRVQPLGQFQVTYEVGQVRPDRPEIGWDVKWHPTDATRMPRPLRAEPVGESSAVASVYAVPDKVWGSFFSNIDARLAFAGWLRGAGVSLVYHNQPAEPATSESRTVLVDVVGPPVPSAGPTVRNEPISGPPVSEWGPPVHADQVPAEKFYWAVVNNNHQDGAQRLIEELAEAGMALVWVLRDDPRRAKTDPNSARIRSLAAAGYRVENERDAEARGRREALRELVRALVKELAQCYPEEVTAANPNHEVSLTTVELGLLNAVLADYLGGEVPLSRTAYAGLEWPKSETEFTLPDNRGRGDAP